MVAWISVILATVAAFALGAGWYGKLSGPWMRAAKVPVGADGKPKGSSNPMLYVMAFGLQLLVAGMMRHVFALSGIDSIFAGLVAGLGIGLFFITPWIALNNLYSQRPVTLTLIDGGYAVLGCAAMGAVLGLF